MRSSLYLRDIGVSIVKFDDMPTHIPSIYLREAEHVVDIFLHFMPRKYTLDGTAKTNLVLGPKPKSERYQNWGPVNQFVLSEFDRDKYYTTDAAQQDQMVLAALETCLLEIAGMHGVDDSAIRDAAAKTRKHDFELKRESKLSRSTKSRQFRLQVFQHLSRRGIFWTLEVHTLAGALIETNEIGKSNSWDSAHDYRKSNWVGNKFVILDHVGHVSFEYDAGKLNEQQ